MNQELQWIENAIEALARTAEKDGVYWRATYTPEDLNGVALLKEWMENAGFETYFDQAGNLYGRIRGKSDAVFLTGSHRDTVADGGKYDGALGIITAIAAGGALYRDYGTPEMTLEVVALCEEEGSRFLSGYTGSQAIVGALSDADLQETDENGISLLQALKVCGYYDGVLPKPREDVNQFLELHIEQGGVLEYTKHQIGIVTAIVGLLVGDIIFHGTQNHAGTTPMDLRRDPVPAAAAFIDELNRWAMSKGEDLVCTIGNVTVEPGKSNVIANCVKLTFDIQPQQAVSSGAKNANGAFTMYRASNDIYDDVITLRYFWLGKEADYVDMAQCYNQYLVEKGVLTKEAEEDKAPFYVEYGQDQVYAGNSL